MDVAYTAFSGDKSSSDRESSPPTRINQSDQRGELRTGLAPCRFGGSPSYEVARERGASLQWLTTKNQRSSMTLRRVLSD